MHQRVLEQAARFQVVQQRRDRLVNLARVLCVIALQILVLIPFVSVADLDEANALLGETARHQALASEVFRDRIVQAVELLCRFRLLAQILQIRSFASACGTPVRRIRCGLPRRDPGLCVRVACDSAPGCNRSPCAGSARGVSVFAMKGILASRPRNRQPNRWPSLRKAPEERRSRSYWRRRATAWDRW